MPVRNSPFERLSARILTATASWELHMAEFVLKRGLATRQPREIEILVTDGRGENLFLVKCCAYKRAQGSLWIEQLDRERLDLGFECVLAVSRSGFTRAAQTEARDRRIATARLTEAEAADWSNCIDMPSMAISQARRIVSPGAGGCRVLGNAAARGTVKLHMLRGAFAAPPPEGTARRAPGRPAPPRWRPSPASRTTARHQPDPRAGIGRGAIRA